MTDLLTPTEERKHHEAQADADLSVPDDGCGYRVDMGGDFTRGAASVVREAAAGLELPVEPYRMTPKERRLLDERRRFHGVWRELP